MEESEFELLGDVQETHWLWRGRKKAIETLINQKIAPNQNLRIADIGAGCGGNFELLSKYGNVFGLEPNEKAITIAQSKFPNVPIQKWQFPEKVDRIFDFILASEVLEHIPDDREATEWIYQHLAPGGYVLITVPAHQYLWTQMDDVVHHKRRYTKKQLQNLFSQFQILKLTYYNFFLFPLKLGLVGYDRIQKLINPKKNKQSFNELPPFWINAILGQISIFESSLLKDVTFPFGPSLILLARKSNSV